MKIKILKKLSAAIFTCYATIAMAGPHWNHDEQAEWGAIRDHSQTAEPFTLPYATCSLGNHQSPVNLSEESHKSRLNKLRFKYYVDRPVFFNSGHGIQVNMSDDYDGHLKIGREIYPLIQFHLHEPSEHMIGNRQFPAELHFVHVREDGKIAVLGILIKLGEDNAALQTVLDNMPSEEGAQSTHANIALNPLKLLPEHRWSYYTLAGSLTTPPCSEGVNWLILAEPITMSSAQLAQLKSFYSDNARHVQDLNGRSVSHRIRY